MDAAMADPDELTKVHYIESLKDINKFGHQPP